MYSLLWYSRIALWLLLGLVLAAVLALALPPTAPPPPDLPDEPDECTPTGAEVCDGVDNDCNDVVDDVSSPPLAPSQYGVCAGSHMVCVNQSGSFNWVVPNYSVWNASYAPVEQGNNSLLCDNLDNDCDNLTDEGIFANITCGLGVCEGNTGNATCVLGEWVNSTCDPFFGKSKETCDHLDNDCDGAIDEGSVCAPPPDDGGGGGGGGSYYPPPAEEEEEPQEEPAPPPSSVLLEWTYKGSTASASVSEPSFAVKRMQGLVPPDVILNGSVLEVVQTGLLPEGVAPFKRYRFANVSESAVGVTLEELSVSFAIDQSWLDAQGDDVQIVVLYKSNGAWREGLVSYSNASQLFSSKLVNAQLQDLVIAAKKELLPASSQDAWAEDSEEGLNGNGSGRGLPAWLVFVISGAVLAALGLGGYLWYHGEKAHGKASQPATAAARPVSAVHVAVSNAFNRSDPYANPSSKGSSSPTSSLVKKDLPSSVASSPRPAPKYPELAEYVVRMRARGRTDEQIRQRLLSAKWSPEAVEESLRGR